jgi:hypothetical protein
MLPLHTKWSTMEKATMQKPHPTEANSYSYIAPATS